MCIHDDDSNQGGDSNQGDDKTRVMTATRVMMVRNQGDGGNQGDSIRYPSCLSSWLRGRLAPGAPRGFASLPHRVAEDCTGRDPRANPGGLSAGGAEAQRGEGRGSIRGASGGRIQELFKWFSLGDARSNF